MRILVVEDEHKIAQFIKTGLELESWAVDLAFDGEAGLDLSVTENYDVIVLDLMLPKISGMEICTSLRKKYQIHTPILILTAKGSPSDKVNGLDSGADDYLVKPFVFSELVARIRSLSRRPQTRIDNELSIEDLKVDTTKRLVSRKNIKILLSKREFALLEFLLKNKGQVKTKDEITQNVWNYDDDILPNTVEVYVSYLRNKIDKSFPKLKPLIHTLRGFGYKIDTNE